MDYEDIKKKKLKKKFRIFLIISILLFLPIICSLYEIITFVPSELFGYLGNVGSYFIFGICLFFLYCIWLWYAADYLIIMDNKKYSALPLLILILVGFGTVLFFVII